MLQRAGDADCSQLVRKLALDNWKVYTGKLDLNVPGHLIAYPYAVDDATGAVSALSDVSSFPDFNGSAVLGARGNAHFHNFLLV